MGNEPCQHSWFFGICEAHTGEFCVLCPRCGWHNELSQELRTALTMWTQVYAIMANSQHTSRS